MGEVPLFPGQSSPREAATRGAPRPGGGCSGRGAAPLSCLVTWSSGRDAEGSQSPCPTPIPPTPPAASAPPVPRPLLALMCPSGPSFPSCCVLISDLSRLKRKCRILNSRLLNPAGVHPGAHCTLSPPFYRFDIFHHKELENINSISVLMRMSIIKTTNHDMVKNILAKSLCGEAIHALFPEAWFSICNSLV